MKENIQEKYMEMQMAHQQMKQIEQQLEAVQNQIMEFTMVKQSLDEFNELKQGSEILVPVANGIFAKAELKENKNLIVNVGANTTVEKDLPKTKEVIDKQIQEISEFQVKMAEEYQKLAKKIEDIEKQISK